ncbi:MAG: hypothetical protein IJL26_00335 [Clostridia bacterium]|nr:hypothetical protein [Clostridia bacterium]
MVPDEPFYYTIPQRLLQGDRLFADEWHLSQLSSLFLLLPFKAFTALNGGAEGAILFMRLLFVGATLCFYLFYCVSLRAYGPAAAVGAALFCADAFAGIPALNYYNLFLHFAATACILLFFSDGRPSFPRLAAAGAALAAAVLCQPGFALAYAVYSLFALLRVLGRRRGKDRFSAAADALAGRSWLALTAGAAVCAAAVAAYLLASVGRNVLVSSVPLLFGDSAHGMTVFGSAALRQKLSDCVGHFGLVRIALCFVSVAAAAVFRLKKRKSRTGNAAKAALLCFTLGAFLLCDLTKLETNTFLYGTAPALFFAAACLLLCEAPDARMTAVFFCAVLGSAATDYFSDVTVLFGARLAYFPAMYAVFTLLLELRASWRPPEKKKKAAAERPAPRWLAAAAVVLAAAALLADTGRLAAQAGYGLAGTLGDPAAVTVDRGPYRGLRFGGEAAQAYEDTLADLDALAGDSDGPFYVGAMQPEDYLYLELPIGTFTTYFITGNAGERQAEYWRLRPEKRPKYVYLPYGEAGRGEENDARIAFLRSRCDCEVSEGNRGFLITTANWR